MNGKSAQRRRLCTERIRRVYEALRDAGGSGAGAVPTDMQARKLPFLPELGSRLQELGREKPSAREAAAKIFCASALRDMELEVDDVRLTQLPDGACAHGGLADSRG